MRDAPVQREGSAFALVLAGGGARGYAHVGVLRELESMGLAPSGLVGVSMGSTVAVTYALRDDWYDALLRLDTSGLPTPGDLHGSEQASPRRQKIQRAWAHARTAWSLLTGWGAPDGAAAAGRASLRRLLGSARLEECRIPVTVCATDLLAGERVEITTGPAVPAVLASSSLAGILPPVELDGRLLVDGVYADIAPVDVAGKMGVSAVIAVDPGQPMDAVPPKNGLQVVVRAMEICHRSHAHERIGTADLVIHPTFDRYVDVLDFGARHHCVEAGRAAVEAMADRIQTLLSSERT